LLGWRVLEAEIGSGRIRLQFEGKPEFVNPVGNIQGGFLAGMLDYVLSDALATTLDEGEVGPTVEFKVNYVHPSKLGVILGNGRVVHKGRSLAFLEGDLRTPDGELIATASGTARIVHSRASF